MDLDPRLLDLLLTLEERRAAGEPVAVADVCRDYPELAEPLVRLIAALGRVDTLLTVGGGIGLPQIPGFCLLEEVGRGGMGVVYRAVDTSLDREVAVKVPLFAVVDHKARERFVREGQALGRLDHPHIVRVFSTGVSGATPFLVMQYVAGGSLAERVGSLRGKPVRVASLVARIAHAVDYAHSLGITHRDLKPSNILIGEAGQPYVSDFGVAALLAGETVSTGTSDTPNGADAPTRLTRIGVTVGTPAYAAPEVSHDSPARLAPAVDIWALGVILSECLTGCRPADGVSQPTAPGRPSVPAGLTRIVRRCLTTDPSGRYPTAAALAAALEAWLRRRRVRRISLLVCGWALMVALTGGLVLAANGPETRHASTAAVLTNELVDRGSVTLVGETGWPRTHRLRSHREIAESGLTHDGLFFVSCPRPCLVELLPKVPADRFTLVADLYHAAGLQDTAVGVYCGHAHTTEGTAGEHRFICLTFSDYGTLKTQYTGPAKRRGGVLLLHGFALRPGDPPDGWWRLFGLAQEWYAPTAGPVWRRVRLDVGPDTLTGEATPPNGSDDFPAVRLPGVKTDDLSEEVSSTAYPRGGLGIYVYSGKVVVRNVRVLIPSTP